MIKSNLQSKGFMVKDNLLDSCLYEDYKEKIFRSWSEGINWITKVRALNSASDLTLNKSISLNEVRDLIRKHNKGPDDFQYLYHSLHESRDLSGVIKCLWNDTMKAWGKDIVDLIPTNYSTNFSLTASNKGCFFDRHTDSGGDSSSYKLTMLLYFGDGDSEAGLNFDYLGAISHIRPIDNRSIIFQPSNETVHWVDEITSSVTPRFALSGWFL